MSLTVRTLHPALGAEITGVDFRMPLSQSVEAKLYAAWMQHLVLVFPEQPLTDKQHVALTRVFGTPEIFHQNIIKSRKMPEIFCLSNVDEDGNLMPPAHPTMQQINLARQWHTDSSYRENPAMGSMLRGVEVSRTGGLTCFINMYAVYDALPGRLREKIEGRKARHDFEQLSRLAATRKLTDEERAAMPPVWQPLVRRHPVTGRKSLYISPIYNDAVSDMEDAEAVELIAELAEFAGREEFIYRHQWKTDDIVLWDNRCTMHLVTPHDPMERRVMHRTTIVGDGPVLAG